MLCARDAIQGALQVGLAGLCVDAGGVEVLVAQYPGDLGEFGSGVEQPLPTVSFRESWCP